MKIVNLLRYFYFLEERIVSQAFGEFWLTLEAYLDPPRLDKYLQILTIFCI